MALPQDVRSRLTYIKWDPKFDPVHGSEKPYELRMDKPEGFPNRNFEDDLGPEELISDIRGFDSSIFQLDEHGFAVRHHSVEISGWDKETVKAEYIPEVERLLRAEFGDETDIAIYNWRLRSTDESKNKYAVGKPVDLNDLSVFIRPSSVVHVDQSPGAALARLKLHMNEKVDLYQRGRWQLINVWRPLQYPIEDCPLAVCDGSTVKDSLLVPVDYVQRTYIGETMRLLPSKDLRWYYLSRQTKEEVLLMKMYDSATHVKAKFCPHAAFTLQNVPADAKPRESIEVRAIVCLPPSMED